VHETRQAGAIVATSGIRRADAPRQACIIEGDKEYDMETLEEALRARIGGMAAPDEGRQPLLSTTGTQAAIAELIARNDRLERAIGELRLEVEALAAAQAGGSAAQAAAAPDR
jgi:hypothetical protein